eukprot:GHVU01061790.1.p1 GENE.GHVU01061790.1~~GHVU01061790.1.p1  ORF type:complete len:226 (+),score=35.88 GHVU01061790.1:101-679(+)
MRVAEGSLKSLEDTLRLLSRDEKDRVRELELLAHGYHVEAGGGSSLQSLATAGRDSSSRLLPVGGQVMTPRSVRGRPGSNRAAVMRPNCSNNSMWEDASGSTTALAAASGSARHHSRARLRPFVFGEQANDSPLQPFRVLHKSASSYTIDHFCRDTPATMPDSAEGQENEEEHSKGATNYYGIFNLSALHGS